MPPGQTQASILWQLHNNAIQPGGTPLGFCFLGRKTLGSGVAAVIPYWFWLLVSVAVGAAPWLRWRKRFSLRTLLVAMTVIAVLLGVVMVAVR